MEKSLPALQLRFAHHQNHLIKTIYSAVSVFSSQARGSPGAFWEQEQESLLFVIEMKRDRLQDQGNKLLQMETLVRTSVGTYCEPRSRDLQISGHSMYFSVADFYIWSLHFEYNPKK